MKEVIINNYNELIMIMILICIIGTLFIIIPIILKKNQKSNKNSTLTELTDKKINKIDPEINIEDLKKEVFSLYKKTEIAKSKFDYDTLKELLDTSLYQEEEQKLKQLKTNKQKIVATNIKLEDIKILSIQKKEENSIIDIYLHASQYDYTINNKKQIIRGTDDSEYQVEYKITIIKNKDKHFKINKKECIGKWIKNN